MKSLTLIQDELSSTLGSVEQARLTELKAAFAEGTGRWFVAGQGR